MNHEIMQLELARLKKLLDNYEELYSDIDNNEYTARGNGFCDAKYSNNFIEGQMDRLRNEIANIEKQLNIN